MRRALIAMVVAALVAGPLAPVGAQEERRALDASARASVMFAELDVQPAFDPALADSRSSSSTIGSSSLQSVVWPSFLVDAFFFLYGFQSVERIALGIAEARWPQGPTEADATWSDLLFINGGPPDALPGQGGRSHAIAAEERASGDVALGITELPGLGTAGAVRSITEVSTDGASVTHAEQWVATLEAGPLRIESIRGLARATTAGVNDASSSLRVVGATVAGTEVVIDDDGVRAATQELQDAVNAALEQAGIQVYLVPGSEEVDAETARASSGGVLVAVEQEGPDPTGGTRTVTVGYLLGAASARARASVLDAPPALPEPPSDGAPMTESITVPGSPAPPPAPPAPRTILRRTIITSAAAGPPIGARGAYAAIMLLGIGLLAIRPLVRAAART